MMRNTIIPAIIAMICLLFSSVSVLAVPAYPYPVKQKQADGTELTVLMKGDEKVHWMETTDGYTLMYDGVKNIVYATLNSEGDMVPSEIIARDASMRSSSEKFNKIPKGLRYSKSQIEGFLKIWETVESFSEPLASVSFRSSKQEPRTVRALCVLVDTEDKPFTKTKADFELLLNQAGYNHNGAKGSVRDFYKETSYGLIDVVFTVAGPYKASKPMSYYGANDNGTRELAREAAMLAFNDTEANLNMKDFDNDGDGQVDIYHFFFSGYSEADWGGEDCIWPHQWVFTSPLYSGSTRLSKYSCSAELNGNSGKDITHIGTICHELGHMFGSPDYYDLSQGIYPGTGNWDVMCYGLFNNNSHSPAHFSMFQKIAFGWVKPLDLNEETVITDMPNSAFNQVAYRYYSSASNEQYILENRQQTGFDTYIPGNGLLIWHATLNARGAYNSNNSHPLSVYPVCAASTFPEPNEAPISYGPINTAGCPFPGTSGNTSFTDRTIPSSKSWAGENTLKPLTNIRESAEGLISFRFMESNAPVSSLRSSVSGQKVTLLWQAPLIVSDGYAIYRDNKLLIKIADPDLDQYIQYNVGAGKHDYCVAVLYNGTESPKQCVSVTVAGNSYNDPVQDLSATEYYNTVSLSWSPITTATIPVTYKIYRDNQYLASTTSTTFKDTHIKEGRHIYAVSWMYNDSESEQACIEVYSVDPNLAPVSNLQSSIIDNQVTLSWDVPMSQRSIGNYDDSFGGSLGNAKIMSVIRWEKEDLKDINGYKLKQVKFIPGELSGCTYWVRIYQNGTKSNVGTLVLEQKVTQQFAQKDWQTIDLNQAISIDATQELCIGIYAETSSGKKPAVYGKNTGIDRKTNLYSEGSEMMIPIMDINWCIAGILESKSTGLSAYSIYRDNQPLGQSVQTTFTDITPGIGEYVYDVYAVYTDIESEKRSLSVNIISTGIKPLESTLARVFPSIVNRGETITIDTGEDQPEGARLSIFSISGKLMLQEIIYDRNIKKNINFGAGIYYLQIITPRARETIQLIVK